MQIILLKQPVLLKQQQLQQNNNKIFDFHTKFVVSLYLDSCFICSVFFKALCISFIVPVCVPPRDLYGRRYS